MGRRAPTTRVHVSAIALDEMRRLRGHGEPTGVLAGSASEGSVEVEHAVDLKTIGDARRAISRAALLAAEAALVERLSRPLIGWFRARKGGPEPDVAEVAAAAKVAQVVSGPAVTLIWPTDAPEPCAYIPGRQADGLLALARAGASADGGILFSDVPLPHLAAELLAVVGLMPGSRYAIRPGETVIGRNDLPRTSVDIDLTEQEEAGHHSVSRRHLAIVAEGARFTVRDLGSKNGTRIDGTRLEPEGEPVELPDGARLDVGRLAFEFRVTR
jgi:hypothetical protein